MPFVLGRLPQNDDELAAVVTAMWGVTLPRHTCGNPDHTAPFTAFADAYFNRNSIVLWHGSRGLSGKSFMLGILGLTKAFLLGADTNLLGGSLAQSSNLHIHMRAAMDYKNAPRFMIETESQTLIKLTNKAKIRPLTASQKTVRGPHPPFLILDEIDEMDQDILDAALGQPMPQKNYLGEILQPCTVMCSTWQNPEGTFTEMRRRFEERGLPIVQWCVAQDSLVTTDRGDVPIQYVRTSDHVMTREGWKPVQHVTAMGYKPTVTVMLSNGLSITLTADHKVATTDGFVEAGALVVGAVLFTDARDADAVSAITPDADVVGVSHVVPPTTGSGSLLMLPSPALVLGSGDSLQMVEPDAEPVPAQVVNGQSLRDRPVGLLVDPAMGEGGRGLAIASEDLVPVPVDSAALPQHARVTAVINHGLILPVWDIGVEECHEFYANHIVVSNCYKCSANPIDGWLTQETIENKKNEIPAEMWRTEYELGEPAIGNRAFNPEAVEKMFSLPMEPIHEKIAKDFEEYTFAEYSRDGDYVAAADWGKEQDYTVISVWRQDRNPYQLVYYMRVNRRPYPQMIGWFNDAIQRYSATAIHDGTGLGNVVNDYVDTRARSFIMTGEKRSAMLSEYVNAVEKGAVVAPRIKTAHLSHKYCQVGDLYAHSKEYHLPDEVCSFSLAFKVMGWSGKPVGPIDLPRDNTPSKLEQMFSPSQGEVYVKSDVRDPDGISLMV
jgi:hypothetical protein